MLKNQIKTTVRNITRFYTENASKLGAWALSMHGSFLTGAGVGQMDTNGRSMSMVTVTLHAVQLSGQMDTNNGGAERREASRAA